MTYYNNGNPNPVSGRGTITYCDPTFDLRARGNWRDVCVGSPCTLFIGSGVEPSWADAFKVAFAGTASLVLVAPGATTSVMVAITWMPRWYFMLGIACLPLLELYGWAESDAESVEEDAGEPESALVAAAPCE